MSRIVQGEELRAIQFLRKVYIKNPRNAMLVTTAL